jgi:hypothetical protein
MNIFEEISWPQFVKLDKINKLQLNEQVKEYNQYIYDLSLARQSWLNNQPKGSLIQQQNFLLQEDGGFLLQENDSNIIIH